MPLNETYRRLIGTGVVIIAAMCLAPPGFSQTGRKIGPGEGSMAFTPDATRPQHNLTVWTYRPDRFGPDSPIVFVMHGVKRNGKTYRDNWAPHSRKGGFLLLVPEFPEVKYPGEAYQQGNVRDQKGQPVPSEEWTFAVIEKLFDHAKTLTGNRSDKYYLYGHSGGGQFVHRFVLFMPKARYARAIAANPGFYTFPSQDAEYPYGLKGTPLASPIEPTIFARDFVLMLGEADTNREDPSLRKTPQADAQGLTRFERGKNYFRAATDVAAKAQLPFHWRLSTVPGVGHSDAKMSTSAARFLFATPR